MSYHLVHVLKHNSRMKISRGCLVCVSPESEERKLPLSDIMGVIIAARGVAFSGESISALLENGAFILHCDSSYRPLGKTMRLGSVVHTATVARQIDCDEEFCDALWTKVLKAKVQNQASVLDCLGCNHRLHELLATLPIDEGNASRHYWRNFFFLFGEKAPGTREHRAAKNPINQQLNYGYAVLGAILHRSLVAHGLNTSIGIHHRFRFKSDPLVYDFLEPLRPFCDAILVRFHRQSDKEKTTEAWIKTVAKELVDMRMEVRGKAVKLIFGIDCYAASAAECFSTGSLTGLIVPKLQGFDAA